MDAGQVPAYTPSLAQQGEQHMAAVVQLEWHDVMVAPHLETEAEVGLQHTDQMKQW